MKQLRYPLLITSLLTAGDALWLFSKNQLSFLQLADHLFLWSLFFLVIGGFLWVFASGFFDTFQKSMHQALSRKRKQATDYQKLSTVGQGSYAFWLITAGLLLFCSLVCLLFA